MTSQDVGVDERHRVERESAVGEEPEIGGVIAGKGGQVRFTFLDGRYPAPRIVVDAQDQQIERVQEK